MKKIFIIVIIPVMSSLVSQSQQPISKGSKIFNFSGSFSSSTGNVYDNETISNFAFTGDISGFVTNGLAFGIQGTVLTEDDQDNSASGQYFSYSTLGIGPQMAYYFGIHNKSDSLGGGGKGFPFLKIFALYDRIKSSDFSLKSGFTIGGDAGLLVTLNKYVGMNISLQYSILNLYYNNNYHIESRYGNTLMISIGITGLSY
ncbi:MAG: hypothetical protein NTW49_10275 [Bacteroidia bacterium]|nr:hypothetical protein [Bacteroidia bacterium]